MKVTHTGFLKRMLNSFTLLIIGIVMFFASFVVLFVNEGRENLANYASRATAYEESKTYSSEKLVYIIGNIDATTYAQDSFLDSGNYLYIKRNVEMYSYIEQSKTVTKENVGGSSTKTTTYTYNQGWTSNPKLTSTFQGDSSELPTNIPSEYNTWISTKPQNQTNTASGFSINGINVSSSELKLTNAHTLNLTSELVETDALLANETVSNGVIYRQNSQAGNNNNPGIGDIRITYQVISQSDRGILFGSFENQSFTPFFTKDNNIIYRFFSGVESHTQATSILQSEYSAALWLSRIFGFLLMFIGLLLFANPIMTLLSVLPIFAKIGRFVYGIIAFLIAFVLTTLTILIGIIFNNIYLATLVVLLFVAMIVFILRKKKNSKEVKKRK